MSNKKLFIIAIIAIHIFSNTYAMKDPKKRTEENKRATQCCTKKCVEESCMIGACCMGFGIIVSLYGLAYYITQNQPDELEHFKNT